MPHTVVLHSAIVDLKVEIFKNQVSALGQVVALSLSNQLGYKNHSVLDLFCP